MSKPEYTPDAWGFAPADCPLTFNMGDNGTGGGLIVTAIHGGKLGLTHIDRLQKADLVPELVAALESAAALVAMARNHFPKSVRNSDRFRLELVSAQIGTVLDKAKGTK